MPSGTVGKLVEAVEYVPRQIDYNEPAGELVKEGVVVDQVLSKGGLFFRNWWRRVQLQKWKLVVFPLVVY